MNHHSEPHSESNSEPMSTENEILINSVGSAAVLDDQQKKVLNCEYFRNIFISPVLRASSASGIIFLVAIQHFELAANEKSLLASANGYGMIAVLFMLPLLRRSGFSIGTILSILYAISVYIF